MCSCHKCTLQKKFKGLAATGAQTAIVDAGAVGGAVAQAFIPIPGVGAAISAGVSAIAGLFTPDYNKIDASNFANEIAAQMLANLNSWYALPASSKTVAVQNYYISNYNNLWNSLVQYCSNPSLGTAGQNCISDREPSGKYPWATYYLDPIQNDTKVIQSNTSVVVTNPTSGVDVTVGGTSSLLDSSESLLTENIAGIPIWVLALGGILLAKAL